MPEQTVIGSSYLWTELVKVGMILQRPAVLLQFLAIVLSFFLARYAYKWIWFKLQQHFPLLKHQELRDTRFSGWKYVGVESLRNLLWPILILFVLGVFVLLFQQFGLFTGYLREGILLAVYLSFYRLLLVSLYSRFSNNTVNYYRRRLLSPLFYLFSTWIVLDLFVDLEDLFKAPLIDLFGETITLLQPFVLIVGLYFWLTATAIIEKLSIQVLGDKKLRDPRLKQILSLFIRYCLIGLGIVILFQYVGISPTAIAAITGGLSVGIGFGLREIISNFVSGIWLLFEGALKPGDVIIVNNKLSQVTKLGMRATTVQVIQDNSEDIIPNQTFFTQNISTFTGSNALAAHSLVVGAPYQCDPAKVTDILLQVVQQNDRILEWPTPQVFALQFGESSIDFELKYWIENPLTHKSVTSQLVCEIWQAFAKNSIEIPYPQRDLHIRDNVSDLKLD